MQKLIDIIVDELASKIETAFSDASLSMTVRRGIPVDEDGDDRFVFDPPEITLVAGQGDTENTSGGQYTKLEDIDADNVRVTWRRGWLTFPIQLDLYTESKTQRHSYDDTLRPLFYPLDSEYGRPGPEGLRLTLSGYFDSTARVVLESTQARDEQGKDQGYAHSIWQLEAHSALLVQTDHEKIDRSADVVDWS